MKIEIERGLNNDGKRNDEYMVHISHKIERDLKAISEELESFGWVPVVADEFNGVTTYSFIVDAFSNTVSDIKCDYKTAKQNIK